MICDQINSEVGSNATVDKLCEYAEELAALQPYPGEIGCFELAEYKIDKQSTIYIKHNHYSVPDHLLGERVIVKLYSEKVVIFDSKHVKVALHSQRVVDEPFREEQKTDEFLEIEMGSDDILSQLESAMEKGTILENKDEEDLGNE